MKPWFLYLKLILTALSRLPSICLTVYRGVRTEIEDEYEKYQTGKEVIWWGFSSCSKNRNIAEKDQFLGETGHQRTLLIIDCIKGKDISKHSYYRKEEEVLLLPATTVKVVNNEHQRSDLHVIRLREIESPFMLLESVTSQEVTDIVKSPPIPNKITPNCNLKLNEIITRCKLRAEIFLIGKRLNDNDIQVIVEQLITNKQCRQLFLRESGVTSQGALLIAEGLFGNKTLELLFISHNIIGDKGAKAIAQSLAGNNNVTLKQLHLGYNHITDEGIEYLADMLRSNKTLTHLWLSSNQIKDQGLQRLAEVLANANKTLQVLALEWNEFCEDSNVDILIHMFKNNQSLTKLSLHSCKLSRSAMKQLKIVAKSKKNFELTTD